MMKGLKHIYQGKSEAPRAKAHGFHSSGANPAPSIPALKGGALGRRGKYGNNRFI